MDLQVEYEIGLIVHLRHGTWRVLLYTTPTPTDADWRLAPTRDLFTPAVRHDRTRPPDPQALERHIAELFNCAPKLLHDMPEHGLKIYTCAGARPQPSPQRCTCSWRTLLFIQRILELAKKKNSGWEIPPALTAALACLTTPQLPLVS